VSEIQFDAAAQRIADEFQRIGRARAQPVAAKGEAGSFDEVLGRFLTEADDLQKKADHAAHDLITGRSDDVHQVMLSMAKADVSFRMMVEVRNKLLEAYQEVMRMQV